MTRQEVREHRLEQRFRFRTPFGIPVSCEIYVETDPDGIPQVRQSSEVEGSHGNRILSQSQVEENEVLRVYRDWRSRPENDGFINRISFLRPTPKKRDGPILSP